MFLLSAMSLTKIALICQQIFQIEEMLDWLENLWDTSVIEAPPSTCSMILMLILIKIENATRFAFLNRL